MKKLKQWIEAVNDWRKRNLFCTASETVALVNATHALSEADLGVARDAYRAGLRDLILIKARPAKFRYAVTVEVDKDALATHATASMTVGLEVADNLSARFRADMEKSKIGETL